LRSLTFKRAISGRRIRGPISRFIPIGSRCLSGQSRSVARSVRVPSDLISSLAHRRHATALSTANKGAVRFATGLPDSRFGLLPDQSLVTRRSLSSARDRMLVTVFHSPATVFAFTNPIPGSTFLTCHFASWPASRSARSALLLHYRSRFAPVTAASSLLARCGRPG